jgi:hypothetical protein
MKNVSSAGTAPAMKSSARAGASLKYGSGSGRSGSGGARTTPTRKKPTLAAAPIRPESRGATSRARFR